MTAQFYPVLQSQSQSFPYLGPFVGALRIWTSWAEAAGVVLLKTSKPGADLIWTSGAGADRLGSSETFADFIGTFGAGADLFGTSGVCADLFWIFASDALKGNLVLAVRNGTCV